MKVVCYVRNPSSYWLSGVQQYLKGSWNLEGIIAAGYKFKNGLTNWGNTVGFENVIVRQFDKSKLVGNDIVTDFCHVLSEITNCDISIPSSGTKNASVYSEQCILMQELRKELILLWNPYSWLKIQIFAKVFLKLIFVYRNDQGFGLT